MTEAQRGWRRRSDDSRVLTATASGTASLTSWLGQR
ncbi:hypothetical protein EV582_1497 [Duganella sp. BK701]|nr:hypothetical protein EV582_1497 [Duganella sp. BK701]